MEERPKEKKERKKKMEKLKRNQCFMNKFKQLLEISIINVSKVKEVHLQMISSNERESVSRRLAASASVCANE